MLNALGVQDRREMALLLAIIALVAVTPLGRESTSAFWLVTYRILLLAIAGGSLLLLQNKEEPDISPIFVSLCLVVLLLMLISLLANPGSNFDGFYRWYQHLFFGAAFLALASLNRQRSIAWKQTLLWSVIVIDVLYVAFTLLSRARPLVGPFSNPNYFASFLLAGFAGGIAIAAYHDRPIARAAGLGASLFLYYAMTLAWSRGATLAATVVVIISVIRFAQGRGLSRTRVAFALIVLLAAGAAASPALVRKFTDRGQFDPYNYQRPRIWMSALQVIAEHPILGVGLVEFYHVSKRFSPPVEGTIARYLKRPGIAHSEYLQYAAETGIPAAALLFSLAGYTVWIALRRAGRCSKEQRVFQETAILVAAGLGSHALVDNNWGVPIMAAGLVTFSLGDVLPLGEWRLSLHWPPRLAAALSLVLLLVVVHAIAIPGLAIHFNESGQAAYQRNDLNAAEAHYRLAAAIAPNHYVFLDNAGTVYMDKFMLSRDSRMIQIAETFFRKAGSANPNAEEPGRRMETLLIERLTGDPLKDRAVHERIVEIDRDVLKVDPFNPFVRKNLAEALYNLGDSPAARRELEKAIELEPNYVAAYLRLADWFRQDGDQARSEEYRSKAMAVVMRYQGVAASESYESLLLGRPQ